METITRRDLSGVRVYSSPLVETLGAQAFTSGERIVFAPGRMEFRSASGLALLGHELTHLGASLAFKRFPGESSTGEAEEAAEGQEALIQRLLETGWPAPPEMAVRRTSQPLPTPPVQGPVSYFQAPMPAAEVAVSRVESLEAGDTGAVAQERLPEARFSIPQAAEPSAGGSSGDVDAMARKVYDILKSRLRAERDRHGRFARAGLA